MKNSKINHAKAEAKRFVTAVEKLHKHARPEHAKNWKDFDLGNYSKESATVRRASMDLTRALADMRRGYSND